MSRHKTFEEFLRCIGNRTRTEFRAAGKKWPVTKPWHTLTELKTADGKRPLKEIWDNLQYFYLKGRDEIQETLREGWKDHFSEDRSELVAKGIESCIMDHGDRSDEEKAEVKATPAKSYHGKEELQERRSIVKEVTKSNLQLKGFSLNSKICGELDEKGISVIRKWTKNHGVSTWREAFGYSDKAKTHVLRNRIHELFRRDRQK